MRYAFIKYGDVIGELLEIGLMPSHVPDSGPKTFSSNYLKLAGNNPTLLLSCGNFKGGGVLIKNNVEARLYNQFSGVMRLFSVFLIVTKIAFRLLKFRADFTVCVQDGPALWATYVTSKITKKPFIHSRQRAINSLGDSWRRRISATIDNYVIRNAERVICHGPFTRSQLLSIGVIDARIIEYDVRLDHLLIENNQNNKLDTIDIETSNKVILFLGRIEESKGVFDLLDACEPLLRTDPEVKLVYVGDGQALTSLKAKVIQKQLSPHVILVGKISHKKIFDYLRSAVLMAMPTQHGLEGWGMSAIEALAMGVPVIAPNAGPFTFMIKNGVNGLLYDVDSVEDLNNKIAYLLSNPDLRNKLSNGAVKSEIKRNQCLITFGEALKIAHSHVSC